SRRAPGAALCTPSPSSPVPTRWARVSTLSSRRKASPGGWPATRWSAPSARPCSPWRGCWAWPAARCGTPTSWRCAAWRRETGRLGREVERLRLASHELVELGLRARLRVPDGPLPATLRAEGERLLGADGPDAATRLGLPAGASDDEMRAAVLDAIERWRGE